MTYTEKAIEKAIEGGWSGFGEYTKTAKLTNHTTVSNPNNYFLKFEDGSDIHIGSILMSPFFWQSLVRAELTNDPNKDQIGEQEIRDIALTRNKALIEHLHYGKDAESFFDNLIKQ